MSFSDNVSYDFNFHPRLDLLADLMEHDAKHRVSKKMRKLQREALKYYPISSTEGIRHWMKIRIAFLACDRLESRLETPEQ